MQQWMFAWPAKSSLHWRLWSHSAALRRIHCAVACNRPPTHPPTLCSKRGGGWAARPGSLTSRQPQQAPKDPGFPSLGGKAGGGREGGTAATKWGGGPPLGVKLLQKPDTLQSLAAKAGLDVR